MIKQPIEMTATEIVESLAGAYASLYWPYSSQPIDIESAHATIESITMELQRRDNELAQWRKADLTPHIMMDEMDRQRRSVYVGIRKPIFVNLDKPLMTMTLFAGKEHSFVVVNGVSLDDLKTDERLRDAFETAASIFEGKATE